MKGTIKPALPLLFCLAAASGTTAQNAATQRRDTLGGHALAGVEVLVARPTASASALGMTLEVKRLERLGGHSVADALRFFSGVQVKDYGGVGGLKTINVHGLGSEHVSVEYDGVPVDNAQNGQTDLGRFSLDNLESVTLFAGRRAGILRPARSFASASAVSLQTRKPSFARSPGGADDAAGGGRSRAVAAFSTGSFGTANPSVRWERQWSGSLSSSFSAEYLYSTGRYRFRYHTDDGYDTAAVRRNGGIRAVRCEAALFGETRGGSWRAQGYFYNSRRGLPGAVVRNRFSNAGRQWDTSAFLQASARKEAGRYSVLVNAKYACDRLRYLHDPHEDKSSMYADNRYRQHQAYISIAQRYELRRGWHAALSADYQMNALNADLHDFAKPVRHSLYAVLATELRLPRLSLQADALLTRAVNKARRAGAGGAARFTELSPAVYAECRPAGSRGPELRAFAKKTFRMPTLNDLYYTFLGNSNLRPEYATRYDIGVTYSRTFRSGLLRSASLEADAYRDKVTDKIAAVPAANLFRWTMLNIGRVRTLGLDITTQAQTQAGGLAADARLAYTFQRAEDRTDRRSPYYGGQIPYIPKHSVSAAAGAEWRGWTLSYSFIYTGGRYDASANTEANRVRPWHTHDVSLSKSARIGKADVRIMLAVNNVANRHYEIIRCYPMPGRNCKITFSAGI